MADEIATAAKTGDRRKLLEAIRDQLAKDLDNSGRCRECAGAGATSTAQLAKALADVTRELADLAPPPGGSRSDGLTKEREERRAQVSKRAAGSKQRGTGSGGAGGKRGAAPRPVAAGRARGSARRKT